MKIVMQIGISAIILMSLICTFVSATENTTTTTENTTTTTEETTYLVESYHPYANNYENTWTITEPGAGEIRVHFTKIELKKYDYIYILDKNDKTLNGNHKLT